MTTFVRLLDVPVPDKAYRDRRGLRVCSRSLCGGAEKSVCLIAARDKQTHRLGRAGMGLMPALEQRPQHTDTPTDG